MAKHLKDLIIEDGVYYEIDPVVGHSVDEFRGKEYPFKTEEGLDFCKSHGLDDKRVRRVLESFFVRPGLGLFTGIGAVPNRVFLFENNEVEGQIDPPAIIMQLFCSESHITYYKGSHIKCLQAASASTGLFEATPARLRQSGIKPVSVVMEKGGLAILDSRCGFTIEKGVAITFAYAPIEEVSKWTPVPLLDLDTLRQKVAKMSISTIGLHFDFIPK